MREAFKKKNFRPESLMLIHQANGIINTYESEGLQMNLRQLYYQLVAGNIIPNTERSYDRAGELFSDARLCGLMDWDMIRDLGRVTHVPATWKSPADILAQDALVFQIDRWLDQPNYVEVMVEKQALEGVLLPVCQEMRVPFTSNKGYSSSSAMYEASKRFLEAADRGKECFVIYLGDHAGLI